MAAVWSTVLIFPPRLAGITRVRNMINRMTVMPHSRSRITMVIHHHISPSNDMVIHAAPVKNLSAIGSAIFPKVCDQSPGSCNVPVEFIGIHSDSENSDRYPPCSHRILTEGPRFPERPDKERNQ